MLLAFVLGFLSSGAAGFAQATPKPKNTQEYMQMVFDYASRNLLSNVQYSSNVYVRHRMHTSRRGQIVRYLPQMFRLERGSNDYLTEAALKFQFRPPGETDCKVVAFHSTSRYLPQQRFTEISRFNFLIYGTKLFSECVLNPLNKRNKRFYRYALRYHHFQDTMKMARIEIIPRFSNDQLVKRGFIDLEAQSGAVRSFRFEFDFQMQHFTVSGRTGNGFYDSVLPTRMRILSRFHLLGNVVNEVYDVVASHTFSCPPIFEKETQRKLDITRECFLRIDTAKAVTSREWFDSIRPFPLRGFERHLYQVKDSLSRTFHGSEKQELLQQFVQDSLNSSILRGDTAISFALPPERKLQSGSQRTQELLLHTHTLNFGTSQRATLKLPALFTPSMVQWSKSKGFSLQARIRFKLDFPLKRSTLIFSPRLGYSFKQNQLYWNVPLHLTFWPKMNGEMLMEAGGGSHMFSSSQANEARKQLMAVNKPDSLIRLLDQFGFHFYRDSYLKADLSLLPHPSWHISLGLRHHRRSLLQWNALAQSAGLRKVLGSLAPHFQVEWTPRQYFYKDNGRSIPVYSKYPTFIFSYERGFGMNQAPTAYERLETDIRYRISLYALRSLYFRTGFGLYTRRERECFLDYDFFRFNNMPSGWDDEMTGEFQLLSSRWYNESKYYVRITSTYESPMLLFSRLPWISHFIQTERVYCNLLSVKLLKFYGEAGYSVSTNLFDIGVFTSFADKQSLGAGFRFVFRFFEN